MISIIVPTYNEVENLPHLIDRIFHMFRTHSIEGELIIVDDDSPDGTSILARKLSEKYKDLKMKVLVRKGERGLSSAVIIGFEMARYDLICVMDADLSHPPEKIPDLMKPVISGEAEIALASRYIKGGGIRNWPRRRLLISKIASLLARPLVNVKDPMSGFFLIRRGVLENKEFNPKGFKIGLEILVKGNYRSVMEVPFIFTDRRAGKSKFGLREIINYLHHLSRLYEYRMPFLFQFIKFCLVGALGVLVNLIVFSSILSIGTALLNRTTEELTLVASALAFLAAVTHNFLLNKRWTFRDHRWNLYPSLNQYLKFILASLTGLMVNLGVLYLLMKLTNLLYLFDQLLGVIAGTTSNFILSRRWVFGSG